MRAARAGGLAAPRLPLVAGGSGRLGRHALQALAEAGCTRVRVLDVQPPPRPPAGIEVEFFRHRLGQDSPDALRGALQGVDSVFSMVAASMEHATKDEMARTSARGVQELVGACSASEAQRLVHVSCTAVTDLWRQSVHQSEEQELPPRQEYRSPFDASVRLGEDAVLAACGERLATVVLRPHAVMSGRGDSVFGHCFDFNGTVVAPEGAALQDHIAAEDLCRALLLAEERLDSPSVKGQAFFVTKGEEATAGDVARLVAEALGWTFTELPAVATPLIGFGSQVKHSALSLLGRPVSGVAPQDFVLLPLTQNTFDNTRAAETLGFESRVSIRDVVTRVVAEFKQHSAGGA